jgi:hypothetical protein
VELLLTILSLGNWWYLVTLIVLTGIVFYIHSRINDDDFLRYTIIPKINLRHVYSETDLAKIRILFAENLSKGSTEALQSLVCILLMVILAIQGMRYLLNYINQDSLISENFFRLILGIGIYCIAMIWASQLVGFIVGKTLEKAILTILAFWAKHWYRINIEDLKARKRAITNTAPPPTKWLPVNVDRSNTSRNLTPPPVHEPVDANGVPLTNYDYDDNEEFDKAGQPAWDR